MDERCYGKTRTGFRCSNKSKYKNVCMHVEYPVCKHHINQDIVYEWSVPETNNHTVPEKIFNFMTMYGRCFYTFNIYNDLSTLISAVVHDSDIVFSLDKENTLELFFDLLFKESKNMSECPICYENKKSVKLKCNHSICKNCISQWVYKNNNCPMCREELSPL